MMKPLLTASSFVFAAILSVTPAFAETTTVYGVSDGQGGFIFFDSRLDSTSGSGFASLSLVLEYSLGYSYSEYTLSTHIDSRNPYVFDPAADIETFSYHASLIERFMYNIDYTYTGMPHYDENFSLIGADITVSSSYLSGFKPPPQISYERTEYYEQGGEYKKNTGFLLRQRPIYVS